MHLVQGAIALRSRPHAQVIGFGVFLEKPFKFTDPVNWAIGDATRTDQTALRQAVQGGRANPDGPRSLDAV